MAEEAGGGTSCRDVLHGSDISLTGTHRAEYLCSSHSLWTIMVRRLCFLLYVCGASLVILQRKGDTIKIALNENWKSD